MKRLFLPAILLLVASFHLQADELVYVPVNPAFGGNAANGDWLLANAQAQDDHDDPDLESRADKTAGELFNESLERALVRNLAAAIASGDADLVLDQVFDYGDFTVILTDLGDNTLQVTTYDEVNDVTTVFTVSSLDI
ncbi:MAG: curli assembly protein CsgF [Pseudomonadota bacterium]